MLHFQYTEYLLSFAAIPVMVLLYFLLVRWKRNAAKKIGDPLLVQQLTKGFSSKKFTLKLIVFIIGFALCGFALAGLVQPDGTQKVNRKGIDVMIALDVSKSMLAQDIKPSRLERAKQVISKIIEFCNNRIALIIGFITVSFRIHDGRPLWRPDSNGVYHYPLFSQFPGNLYCVIIMVFAIAY